MARYQSDNLRVLHPPQKSGGGGAVKRTGELAVVGGVAGGASGEAGGWNKTVSVAKCQTFS